jgi:hypothetical protein
MPSVIPIRWENISKHIQLFKEYFDSSIRILLFVPFAWSAVVNVRPSIGPSKEKMLPRGPYSSPRDAVPVVRSNMKGRRTYSLRRTLLSDPQSGVQGTTWCARDLKYLQRICSPIWQTCSEQVRVWTQLQPGRRTPRFLSRRTEQGPITKSGRTYC